MRSVRLIGCLSGLALVVAGCSSASSGGGDPTPQPATSSTAVVAAGTPSADSAGDSGDDNLASRICTALSPATAELQMASASPADAVTKLKQVVAKAYAPGEAVISGADLDARTKKTCPDLRDEVLLTIDRKSLADLA